MTAPRHALFLSAMIALGMAQVPMLTSAHASPLANSGHDHHRPGGFPHGHGEMMMPMIPPGVTLTADQKDKFKAIFEKAHQDERALRLEGRTLDEKIHDALMDVGQLNRASLSTLNAQSDAIHAKASALRLETMEQVHDLLTPEQRQQNKVTMEKIKALHEQMQALFHHPADEDAPDDMP